MTFKRFEGRYLSNCFSGIFPEAVGRLLKLFKDPISNLLSKTLYFLFTGSFPLSSQNELTRGQRATLLPVMESLLRVMETSKPSVRDVNTLMVQVRDLLKQVPEGKMPDLRQYGFDVDSLPFGMDLETLKNVALPKTGDIAITENGQDKIVTGFGEYLSF